MKKLIAALAAVLLTAGVAGATTLSLGDPFTTGETITAAKFNNKFNATAAVINGSIDSGNITDGSITDADIQSNTITGAKILDDTIQSADIADNTITTDDIGPGGVDTSELVDGGVATADIAAGATMVTYQNDDGTKASPTTIGDSGVCVTRPTINANMDQAITSNTGDILLVTVTAYAVCTGNCGNEEASVSCRYNGVDDTHAAAEASGFDNGSRHVSIAYQGRFSAINGTANMICVVWCSGGNMTATYYARQVIQHIKR